MKRYYAVTMENGDEYGIPAEVIADNYARYYASLGENYRENFDAMMHWFDLDSFEFSDWAKGNMDWRDVEEKAVLLKTNLREPDFQNSWVNGEYRYLFFNEDSELTKNE